MRSESLLGHSVADLGVAAAPSRIADYIRPRVCVPGPLHRPQIDKAYWLSQETGIRWATLAAMVNGTAQRLDLDALERICDALECHPGELLVKVERRKGRKR